MVKCVLTERKAFQYHFSPEKVVRKYRHLLTNMDTARFLVHAWMFDGHPIASRVLRQRTERFGVDWQYMTMAMRQLGIVYSGGTAKEWRYREPGQIELELMELTDFVRMPGERQRELERLIVTVIKLKPFDSLTEQAYGWLVHASNCYNDDDDIPEPDDDRVTWLSPAMQYVLNSPDLVSFMNAEFKESKRERELIKIRVGSRNQG
jgi:hypothetical protein